MLSYLQAAQLDTPLKIHPLLNMRTWDPKPYGKFLAWNCIEVGGASPGDLPYSPSRAFVAPIIPNPEWRGGRIHASCVGDVSRGITDGSKAGADMLTPHSIPCSQPSGSTLMILRRYVEWFL